MSDFSVDDEQLLAHQTQEIEAAVSQVRQEIASMTHTGKCLFCDDPLEIKTVSFCDEYCRDFYQREQHNRKVKGCR